LIAVDGTNVDLHRTFVMGPLGLRVGLDELWADGEAFTIGGAAVHALAPLHRLLAACYNAIAGDRSPRLSTLRDIAQLILSGDVDADLAVDTAGRWGAEHVLALGVEAAWARLQIADVVGLSAWASRYETDDVDRRLLRLYHDDGAGYSGLSWATARMLPVGQRVAFLSALAFPKGGRLGELGWGVGQRVRRAVRGYSRASM
ncbi:MAG: nucleotidyltransferase family protein, partial [Actinomycetes bacterium]